MSDYPMLISNKLHSFRNFRCTKLHKKTFFRSHIDEKTRWIPSKLIAILIHRLFLNLLLSGKAAKHRCLPNVAISQKVFCNM